MRVFLFLGRYFRKHFDKKFLFFEIQLFVDCKDRRAKYKLFN